MRKVLAIACLFAVCLVQAQDNQPTYKAVGDLVEATYYFADGSVHKKGFFKNQKLTGKWTEFDQKGNRVAIGYYNEGKKVGTWVQWKNNKLRQISYDNNVVASVSAWEEDVKIAISKQ
ncbi:nicotinic acid mononucleotide adenyltransferase [Pseudotenacibaculum sp. MALMAid0570]|uniref:toxin-antitoxin system YwqK family antitoxin n=1 Tax=Pseudotenacibaculum sp. MALMAid0570 TaxID=3143938 RepID=UPI0032DFBD69